MVSSEVSWPVDDQRRANATFVDAPFATFEACIPAKAIGPIVVEVHDDRLIAKPQLIECRKQASDVLIEIFHHGNGRPRGRFVFFFSRASLMPHLEFAAIDPIHERIGYLHRRVGGVEGYIAKERVRRVIANEFDRMIGEVICDKALASDGLAVSFQGRGEVVAPVPRAKPIELVKASGVGVVGVLRPVVPFAEGTCGIAMTLEPIGQGGFIQIQTLVPLGDPHGTSARMVSSGEELSPRRSANRANIKPLTDDAIGG